MAIINPIRNGAKVLDTEETLVRIVADIFTYNMFLFIALSVFVNRHLSDPTL